MADLRFDADENEFGRPVAPGTRRSSWAAWLIKKGIAKNERQAQYILLSVAAVGIVIALMSLVHSNAPLPTTQNFSQKDGVMPVVNPAP